MGTDRDNRFTLHRLLRTKKLLGLSGGQPEDSGERETLEQDVPKVCISCGYRQEGQIVDRCPECGLRWAGRICDPTPWTGDPSNVVGWWHSALKVWTWDRRIRIRTSLVPVTPESRRFAMWSAVLTAGPLGVALALANTLTVSSNLMQFSYFLFEVLLRTVAVGLLLVGVIHASTLALGGVWRRRLQFVPASVHYSTAWWPVSGLLAFVASCLATGLPDSDLSAVAVGLAILGVVLWTFWLWASVTESQHVFHVAGRIMGVTLLCALLGAATLWLLTGSVRSTMKSMLTGGDRGLARVKLFGTFAAGSGQGGPQTYALLIDTIPSDDEVLILECITRLGAHSGNRVAIRGGDCTAENINATLKAARSEVKPEDRLIVYIHADSVDERQESVRIADGEITAERLSGFLSTLRTSRCLVVVDTRFGEEFVAGLGYRIDAVTVTPTGRWSDRRRSGLRPFWEAWLNAQSDEDNDGQVTVDEAFWRALVNMLGQDGEQQTPLPARFGRYEEKGSGRAGFGEPALQREILGDAKETDFAIATQPNTNSSP